MVFVGLSLAHLVSWSLIGQRSLMQSTIEDLGQVLIAAEKVPMEGMERCRGI